MLMLMLHAAAATVAAAGEGGGGRGGQKSLEEDDQVRRATSGQCVHGRWKAVRTGFQLLEGTHMGHTDHTKVPYRSCLA